MVRSRFARFRLFMLPHPGVFELADKLDHRDDEDAQLTQQRHDMGKDKPPAASESRQQCRAHPRHEMHAVLTRVTG